MYNSMNILLTILIMFNFIKVNILINGSRVNLSHVTFYQVDLNKCKGVELPVTLNGILFSSDYPDLIIKADSVFIYQKNFQFERFERIDVNIKFNPVDSLNCFEYVLVGIPTNGIIVGTLGTIRSEDENFNKAVLTMRLLDYP